MGTSMLPADFFEEEIRCGYRVSTKIKKVWACQLNLLEEFQKVCERHSLKFWLDSGTLLGAVRHKGYIPWDDDIDVAMPRSDYDRLVEIADSEFSFPLIFQTAYNQKNYVRGHAQLRDARTTAIIPEEINKEFNQGIFIDIFVLDYIPDNEDEYAMQCKRAMKMKKHLDWIASPFRDLIRSRRTKALCYKILHCTRFSFNRLYYRYEDIFRKNLPEKCSNLALAAWSYTSYKRKAEYYQSTIYLDFEFLRCPAPAGYDKLLTSWYGDYMTPVQAPTKHGKLILDPDKAADGTIKELRAKDRRH